MDVVYKGWVADKGIYVAVKQIDIFIEHMDQASMNREYEMVSDEVRILRQLDHPNIVHFFGTQLTRSETNNG